MDKRKNSKRKKTVYQYTKDLELIAIYESTSDAAEKLGISQGNICQCCNRAILKTNGFIFSYEPLTEVPSIDEAKRRKYLITTSKACRKYQKNPKNKERYNIKAKARYYITKYGCTKEDYEKAKEAFWNVINSKKQQDELKTSGTRYR